MFIKRISCKANNIATQIHTCWGVELWGFPDRQRHEVWCRRWCFWIMWGPPAVSYLQNLSSSHCRHRRVKLAKSQRFTIYDTSSGTRSAFWVTPTILTRQELRRAVRVNLLIKMNFKCISWGGDVAYTYVFQQYWETSFTFPRLSIFKRRKKKIIKKQNSHMVFLLSCASYSIFVRVNNSLHRLQRLHTAVPSEESLELFHWLWTGGDLLWGLEQSMHASVTW